MAIFYKKKVNSLGKKIPFYKPLKIEGVYGAPSVGSRLAKPGAKYVCLSQKSNLIVPINSSPERQKDNSKPFHAFGIIKI
jgi:hypothetical protein